MSKNDHLLLVIKQDTGRCAFYNKKGEVSPEAEDGKEIRIRYERPYDAKFSKHDDSSLVERLPLAATIPEKIIFGMDKGRPEEFRLALGFASADTAPPDPTVAIWARLKGKKLADHEFIIGGPEQHIYFPMSRFLGKDGRDQGTPDTVISCVQRLEDIRFMKNSNVSEWELLHEM